MKIGVLLILINFGNLAFSQKLFLRFTPMLGVSFGTFKSHIKESTNNTISYLPVNNLGNIGYSSLNYSLQVDFLKFGNKLEAGLMVGNVSDFSGYTFEYFSQFPFTQEEGSTVYRSRLTTSSTRLDIGFSVSYRFTNQRDSSRWNKRIIIQPMFSFNRASDSGMKQTQIPMKDGYLVYTENYDNLKRDDVGFALNLMYEWELLNKKNTKNKINFRIGYRQGFTVTSKNDYHIYHSNGMDVQSKVFSKTSGFYFGISKPLNFIK